MAYLILDMSPSCHTTNWSFASWIFKVILETFSLHLLFVMSPFLYVNLLKKNSSVFNQNNFPTLSVGLYSFWFKLVKAISPLSVSLSPPEFKAAFQEERKMDMDISLSILVHMSRDDDILSFLCLPLFTEVQGNKRKVWEDRNIACLI